MYFTLRIDLDYVPWDTPDATEFGHGEPAVFLRLLEMAKITGYKLHFFASNRVLRAFPAEADAVLNEGHDLDWLCKHLGQGDARFAEARELFASLGHTPIGFAIRGSYPGQDVTFPGIETLKFVSAQSGAVPDFLKLFPVEARAMRDAVRGGLTTKSWADAVKSVLRDAASRNLGATVIVRPQVLAKFDPRLNYVREVLDLATAVGLPVKTLRDMLN